MAKKTFDLDVRFIFNGKVSVKAENRKQAQEYIEKCFGLCLGGDIHTTLPDEDIDWDFPVHPEKSITRIS